MLFIIIYSYLFKYYFKSKMSNEHTKTAEEWNNNFQYPVIIHVNKLELSNTYDINNFLCQWCMNNNYIISSQKLIQSHTLKFECV